MDRDSCIAVDDASQSPSIKATEIRLDSGFLSGGSLASCQNVPISSGAAASKEYSRMDSGLCEQMEDSLTITANPREILSAQSFRQSAAVAPHPTVTVTIPSPSPMSTQQPVSPPPLTPEVVQKFYGVDSDGDTQLHLAIADGATQIVFALIRMAPDSTYLDIQNNEMYAPLHIAVLCNQQAMVRRLVLAGAAIDIRDREGNTPLHLAAKRGFKDCADALIRSISTEELNDGAVGRIAANPAQPSPSTLLNMKNYNGEHCIHLATFGQHYELIWFLNQQQADVSSLEGRSGKTALHYAVNMGDEALVKLLALPKSMGGCGVWLNARDWSGRTAFQCCMINGDENIGNFLASLPGCDTSMDDINTSDEDFEFDTEQDGEEAYNDIEVNGIRIVNSIA